MNFWNVVDSYIVDTANIWCKVTATADANIQSWTVFQILSLFNQTFAFLSDGRVPAKYKIGIKVLKVKDWAKVHIPIGPLHDVSKSSWISEKLVVARQTDPI